ncbi:MAG TPA: hypothetical protein VN837_01755, partial [Chloroflexota bacterium]|nr:hypothetical protein [Chloroflexota bacterium]
PAPPPAMVMLSEPASGSQFQINTAVPLAYQQAPVQVQATGIRPGSLHLLINGRLIYRFSGLGGEWMWPLRPGTYRLQAVGEDIRGRPVLSGVSMVKVLKPQTPL